MDLQKRLQKKNFLFSDELLALKNTAPQNPYLRPFKRQLKAYPRELESLPNLLKFVRADMEIF